MYAEVSLHDTLGSDLQKALGGATNTSNHLDSFFANGSYLWDKTLGLPVGYNALRGDDDALLYGTANGSPNSDWFLLELDWVPFNKAGGPSYCRNFNPKLSAQYGIDDRFDGTRANASDNITFYLQLWLLF